MKLRSDDEFLGSIINANKGSPKHIKGLLINEWGVLKKAWRFIISTVCAVKTGRDNDISVLLYASDTQH